MEQVFRIAVPVCPDSASAGVGARFRESFRDQRPVVFDDLLIPAVRTWHDREYLIALSTQSTPLHRVQAPDTLTRVSFDPSASSENSIERPWGEAVRLALSSGLKAKSPDTLQRWHGSSDHKHSRYYLKSDLTPELRADLSSGGLEFLQVMDSVFGLMGRRRGRKGHGEGAMGGVQEAEGFDERDIKIWIGSEGTTTPLHFDMAHAVILQIFGSKRITLFPPSQSRNLYPFAATEGAPRTSRLVFVS